MGRRKTSNSKKKASKKDVKTFSSDFHGGILVAIGIILFVLLTFKDAGTISDFLNNITRGFFGNLALTLPLVLIIVGIHEIASEKKTKPYTEIYKGVIKWQLKLFQQMLIKRLRCQVLFTLLHCHSFPKVFISI